MRQQVTRSKKTSLRTDELQDLVDGTGVALHQAAKLIELWMRPKSLQ